MAAGRNQLFENMEVSLIELGDEALTQKDVKNEECSQWLLENKGARRVLPMS